MTSIRRPYKPLKVGHTPKVPKMEDDQILRPKFERIRLTELTCVDLRVTSARGNEKTQDGLTGRDRKGV